MLLVPIVPPLLAAGMTSADDCACGSIPCGCGSDYGTCCRAFSPISGTLVVLLLLGLRLLLSWRLLLRLWLLLRLRCRWCLP